MRTVTRDGEIEVEKAPVPSEIYTNVYRFKLRKRSRTLKP